MKTSVRILALASVVVLAWVAPAAPAGAISHRHTPRVVADGLDNPRGLAWGPGGVLLVAESGRGGSGPCFPGVFTAEDMCFGRTGAVTVIPRHGRQHRILTGLPSIAEQGTGAFAFGPSDVSAGGTGLYLSIGGPGPQLDRSVFGSRAAKLLGTVQRLGRHGWDTVADLAAFERANDPDAQLHESNTTSVLSTARGTFAIDAAGNTLFAVRPHHTPRLLATFTNRTAGDIEYQSVPTALADGPDGAVYVADLTGAPFPAGQSRVWRWTPKGLSVFADGFTSAVDLAFGPDGSLYVLEVFPGDVVRVRPDGTRSTAVPPDAGLSFPTGLAVGQDGSVYVSNCGNCAGTGTVMKFGG
jgi:hypothetical protein